VEPDVPPVVAKVVRKGEKNAMIYFSMGEPAWSPDYEIASKLQVGKPLPPDWKVEQGQYGPKALPPKKGGGMAVAYRNTKEAFEAEAASRLAWQQVEEERKDRRTALMQAAELAVAAADDTVQKTLLRADLYYEWLRSSPAVSEPAAERDVASTDSRDSNTTVGRAGGTSSAPGEQATGSTSGEAGAGVEPGGVPQPASPGFPISPGDCDHKGPSGRWLPTKVIDGQARCPRCGESAVIYRETA